MKADGGEKSFYLTNDFTVNLSLNKQVQQQKIGSYVASAQRR